ncbi:MAG: OmpA family protein [Gammaproteobacteria bacterium]
MATRKRPTARPRLKIVGGNGAAKPPVATGRKSPADVSKWPTRIYFSRASSTPTGGSLTTLRKYAEWLARGRMRRVFVVGHANQRLWDKAAVGLADARARSVKDLLVWLGAERDQVRKLGAAAVHRIRPGTTRGDRAAHRYVELIVAPDGSIKAKQAVPAWKRPARAAAGGRRRPAAARAMAG